MAVELFHPVDTLALSCVKLPACAVQLPVIVREPVLTRLTGPVSEPDKVKEALLFHTVPAPVVIALEPRLPVPLVTSVPPFSAIAPESPV